MQAKTIWWSGSCNTVSSDIIPVCAAQTTSSHGTPRIASCHRSSLSIKKSSWLYCGNRTSKVAARCIPQTPPQKKRYYPQDPGSETRSYALLLLNSNNKWSRTCVDAGFVNMETGITDHPRRYKHADHEASCCGIPKISACRSDDTLQFFQLCRCPQQHRSLHYAHHKAPL